MSDIKIIITDRNGSKHNVDAPTDMAMNIMELIRMHELAEVGTIGICGGMAMCASCQCYILSNHNIPPMGEEEEAMLSETFNSKENSRLGCQIIINKNLNNLEIEIAQES